MFKSISSALLWRGLLAVGIGVVSVAWPGITVGALVILFAVFAFLAAVAEAAARSAATSAGPVAGYLLLALLSLAAGVAALAWPGITALVLTIWVAAWAFITGTVEVAMAFRPASMPANARCGHSPVWSRSRSAWCWPSGPTSAPHPGHGLRPVQHRLRHRRWYRRRRPRSRRDAAGHRSLNRAETFLAIVHKGQQPD